MIKNSGTAHIARGADSESVIQQPLFPEHADLIRGEQVERWVIVPPGRVDDAEQNLGNSRVGAKTFQAFLPNLIYQSPVL